LEYFKEIEKHTFTLSHFWVKLKDYPRWKENVAAWHKDDFKRRADDLEIDLEEDGPSKDGPSKDQQGGHKANKIDLQRQASSIAMKTH
jgi:hypothetical protein